MSVDLSEFFIGLMVSGFNAGPEKRSSFGMEVTREKFTLLVARCAAVAYYSEFDLVLDQDYLPTSPTTP